MATSTLLFAGLCAAAIGLILGLIGGGGSILTVPVFVYVLGYPAKEAIAMSLPVVGATSLVGAIGHWRAGNIQVRVGLAFGVVAMAGSFLGAKLAAYIAGPVQLLLLGVVMLTSATLMLRSSLKTPTVGDASTVRERSVPAIAAVGFAVGMLTGIVGIGGGFLIVPALVVLGGVPMKPAIGTSLLVIAMNAVSGFAGYAGTVVVDWRVMGLVTMVAMAGIVIGTALVKHVSAARLKLFFAIFLMTVAVFVLYQNRGALFAA